MGSSCLEVIGSPARSLAFAGDHGGLVTESLDDGEAK